MLLEIQTNWARSAERGGGGTGLANTTSVEWDRHLEGSNVLFADGHVKWQQEMFHQTPGEFGEWIFPSDSQIFGCEIVLAPQNENFTAPVWKWEQNGFKHQLFSDSGSKIDLWRNSSGDWTEIYEQDPRTLPLFQSPAHTLWPGELTATALKNRHSTI